MKSTKSQWNLETNALYVLICLHEVTGNLTRTTDFPAAIIPLCNANSEFDHESQTCQHSVLEPDAIGCTVLGNMNIKWCVNTLGWSSKGAEMPKLSRVEHSAESLSQAL